MYVPDLGQTACLIAAGVLAFAYRFVGVGDKKLPIGQREYGDYHEMNNLAGMFATFGAVFSFSFAIANPLLQIGEMTRAELERQVGDGSLVLRVATVVFSGALIFRLIQRARLTVRQQARPGDIMDSAREQVAWLNRDIAQGSVFAATLTMIWLLYAQGYQGVELTALSLLFTFFADDWLIISAYSRHLHGRILKSHILRIGIANLLLVGPLLLLAWQEFSWRWAGLWSIGAVMALASVYLGPREARQTRVDAGEKEPVE